MATLYTYFILAVVDGKLEKAKHIYDVANVNKVPINIHSDNENPFRWSCINGHLEVAKWLWCISNETIDLTKIDVEKCNGDIIDFVDSIK